VELNSVKIILIASKMYYFVALHKNISVHFNCYLSIMI